MSPPVVIVVLAALAALSGPAGAPNHSAPARPSAWNHSAPAGLSAWNHSAPPGPSAWAVASGSLATFQPAVLPVETPNGGVVTAARAHLAPAADHAMIASALTGSGLRQQRGRPPWSPPARRPNHRTAGDPRAPPAALRPS